MTSFFKDVIGNINNMSEEYTGPDFKYYKMIKNPNDLGMSEDGSAIGNNISGLKSYVDILISGGGNASKTGQPLGEKFFLKTGAKCKDTITGNLETRSLYFNTIPEGNVDFIDSGMGQTFSKQKGLVPGIISNMEKLNPLTLFQSFMQGNNPDCQKISMPILKENIESIESGYVTNNDIKSMPPCWFSDKKNPITNETCQEGFANLSEVDKYRRIIYGEDDCGLDNYDISKLPKDIFIQLYYFGFGILLLYIFIKLYMKNN